KKKTVKQLKLRVGLIVFWHLRVSFFPDTYFFILINQRIDPKFGSTFPLECNQLNDQQFDHSS
ncbi:MULTISPECIES: hypothetical protein, partial [unclassified Lactobacillus]|uniref:hypothetical protein n=1 Tax=unclassified Lactobacillus TaxID=2620435 RepID=UPI000BEEA456